MDNQFTPQSPTPEAVPPQPAAPKKNNMPIIIGAIVAAVLCCCCLLVLGLVVVGPSISNTFNRTNPPADNGGTDYTDPGTDNGTTDTGIPTGGIGNEILRRDIWTNILAASGQVKCTPAGADQVVIYVSEDLTTNADGAATWAEVWSVTCTSGDVKDFAVSYVQDASGVNFKITMK